MLILYYSWQAPKRVKFTEVRPAPVKSSDKPDYRENDQVEVIHQRFLHVCGRNRKVKMWDAMTKLR